MAGDWIKMRADLHTHPKVVRISSALHADRLRVIGGLHAVWCLFDVHSEDGSLSGYTTDAVDELIGFSGFASAMCAVKWLSVEPDGLNLPEFDEHNGQSAKRRASETKRKRIEREEAEDAARKLSASGADKKRSREEKRREDKEDTPQPPQAGGAGVVCEAIRGKGVTDVIPSHPELLALIAKGVSVSTFEAAATTCANSRPPKGMAYLLGIVKRQISEAESIAAGPSAAALDPDSMQAVIAEGVANGIGPWDEIEQWPLYKARVRGHRATPSLDIAALAGLAQQRAGVTQ